MTSKETEHLRRLVAAKAKLAKTHALERAAALRAHFETELAAIYDPEDARWKEIVDEAERAVDIANEQLEARCKAAGVPDRFRPRLNQWWCARGENVTAERRTELRNVAKAQIDAMVKAANTRIDEWALGAQTELVRGQLTSADAAKFLEALPDSESLLPLLSFPSIKLLAAGKDED